MSNDQPAMAFDPDSTPDPFALPEISSAMLDPNNDKVLPPGAEPAVQVRINDKPKES